MLWTQRHLGLKCLLNNILRLPELISERGRGLFASRIWAAWKEGGVVFDKGLKCSISNWEAVSVWDDFWLASGPLRKQIEVPLMDGEGNISVKDFLSNDIGISFFLPVYIIQEIKGILLASNPCRKIYTYGIFLRMEISISNWLMEISNP